MLSAPESCGSVFANRTPLASGAMRSNRAGAPARSRHAATQRSRRRGMPRKGRQYSVNRCAMLMAVLLLGTARCREQQVDQGALLTARTVGLAHLERGRLAEAEQEFRKVI